MPSKYAILLLAALCGGACKNTKNNNDVTTNIGASEKDFADFYEKFHTDSNYQMAHIVFPLEGLPSGADSAVLASGLFYHQSADWRMQHSLEDMDKDMDYSRHLSFLTPDFARETIYKTDSTYAMERRFAHIDSSWFLIYYAGMNRLQR